MYVSSACNRQTLCLSYIKTLRSADWKDTEIFELVQVVAMSSYFVRVINGVGIELGDEKLGLY